MKHLTFVFSAALCLAAFPAFADGTVSPNKSITLAQAEVTSGPNGVGVGIGEDRRDRERVRDRDRDRDRRRERLGDRDGDRGCRTVTVQERGETRTTRRCD